VEQTLGYFVSRSKLDRVKARWQYGTKEQSLSKTSKYYIYNGVYVYIGSIYIGIGGSLFLCSFSSVSIDTTGLEYETKY